MNTEVRIRNYRDDSKKKILWRCEAKKHLDSVFKELPGGPYLTAKQARSEAIKWAMWFKDESNFKAVIEEISTKGGDE